MRIFGLYSLLLVLSLAAPAAAYHMDTYEPACLSGDMQACNELLTWSRNLSMKAMRMPAVTPDRQADSCSSRAGAAAAVLTSEVTIRICQTSTTTRSSEVEGSSTAIVATRACRHPLLHN